MNPASPECLSDAIQTGKTSTVQRNSHTDLTYWRNPIEQIWPNKNHTPSAISLRIQCPWRPGAMRGGCIRRLLGYALCRRGHHGNLLHFTTPLPACIHTLFVRSGAVVMWFLSLCLFQLWQPIHPV